MRWASRVGRTSRAKLEALYRHCGDNGGRPGLNIWYELTICLAFYQQCRTYLTRSANVRGCSGRAANRVKSSSFTATGASCTGLVERALRNQVENCDERTTFAPPMYRMLPLLLEQAQKQFHNTGRTFSEIIQSM